MKVYIVQYMHSNDADCQSWFGFTGATPKGVFLSLEEARKFVQTTWPEVQEIDTNCWGMQDGDEVHLVESTLIEN